MENVEKNEIAPNSENKLSIDTKSLKNLDETRKWTMFFAILGFIGIGLMVLAAIVLVIIGVFANGYLNNMESSLFGVLTISYLVLGALYFLPVLYLLKFSTNMKLAIERLEQTKMVEAFNYLRSHFKFVGILTIVIFSLYILFGLIAAIGGLFSIL